MKIFSYRPLGKEFEVAFAPRDDAGEPGRLIEGEEEGLYTYFEIPGSKKYLLKILLPRREYKRKLSGILEETLRYAPLYLILILILSIVFALYALHPLKKALMLNEEFVKDLLHDINTPLSAIRINVKLLRKRWGEDRSLERLAGSVKAIESLQANLYSFLHRQPLTHDRFSLRDVLKRRVDYFRQFYPGIVFRMELPESVVLECNEEAFVRIVDNLLSNAGKYNRKGGEVKVFLEGRRLIFEDTGVGIRNPEKVFERYYREGERGLGLGLHIVKKLASEVGIGIGVASRMGQGTRFILELDKVIVK
jgi:signal transduction histidine kinase